MKKRMKDIAYEKIHNMILTGELSPNELINESRLANELKISRTPIREALQRLESEGYIRTYPNRGSVVNKMDMDDVVKVSEIRQALECFAIRKACDNIDKSILLDLQEQLRAIQDLSNEDEKEKSYILGRKLHNEILKCTHNDLLVKELHTIAVQLNTLMAMCREVQGREQITYQQHLDIIEALLTGDSDQAEKSMRIHLVSVTNDILGLNKAQYF